MISHERNHLNISKHGPLKEAINNILPVAGVFFNNLSLDNCLGLTGMMS